MYERIDKNQENKIRSVSNAISRKRNDSKSPFQFKDNRHEAVTQKKIQGMANTYSNSVIQMMFRRTPFPKKLTTNPKNILGPRLTGGSTIYSYIHWNSSDGPHSFSSVFIDTMIANAKKNGKLKKLANDILLTPKQNKKRAIAYFYSKSNTHSRRDMGHNMKYYNDDYKQYFDKAIKGDAEAIRKAYNLRAGGVTSVAPKERLSVEQMKEKGERWNNALEDIIKISKAKIEEGINLSEFIESEDLKNLDRSKSKVIREHIFYDLNKIGEHHKKAYNKK